jgi:LysR family hydrogen peroxide-inducible transcriptional activator
MNLPTLRQLHYLTTLVEVNHFGRAAEKCYVSQSTLSAGIQDLESILGTALFERTNRKVMPTQLGLEIASRAQHILSLSADLVDLAQSEKSPLIGRIRIGIIPSISPFLLPKSLPTIRKELPDLELVLIEDQSERLLEKLRSGEIDVAVLAFPYEVDELAYEVFAEEQFWVALPKNHPLTHQDTIKALDLPLDDLLLLSEGHCMREHALSACKLPVTSHRSSMQGTSLYTLIEMVAGGLGITLIPGMAINSDMVRHADIVVRPLVVNDNKPMRSLGLVWRPSYRRMTTVERLNQHFSDALQADKQA